MNIRYNKRFNDLFNNLEKRVEYKYGSVSKEMRIKIKAYSEGIADLEDLANQNYIDKERFESASGETMDNWSDARRAYKEITKKI